MDEAYSHHYSGWQTGVTLRCLFPSLCMTLVNQRWRQCDRCWRGRSSRQGKSLRRLRRFADYLGRRHALAVTSCTGALHLSLLALGIGAGDEVITTPMTFIATSTAIMAAGAKPVFVDVEPGTGNLNASLIEAAITPRTKAIIPVHLYGQMCDMRAIRAIADSRPTLCHRRCGALRGRGPRWCSPGSAC